MTVILQQRVPEEMRKAAGLPGIAPCGAQDWLRVDEAYGAQMARRLELLKLRRGDVIWLDERAQPAAAELLELALALLPQLGFEQSGDQVICPDGRKVRVSRTDPLGSLGAVLQEDFCLLEKRGSEHVLTGAVLCFPASWSLAEKVARPLSAIHDPVKEYDAKLAMRVQRLFDGVQIDRPLWRMNQLWYEDAELHQPRSQTNPRAIQDGRGGAAYYRSERQCILRLPRTNAVVFSIHTYVLNASDAPMV